MNLISVFFSFFFRALGDMYVGWMPFFLYLRLVYISLV